MAQEKMTERIVTVVITLVVAGVIGVIGSALGGGALIGALGGVQETKPALAERVKALEARPAVTGIPVGAVMAFDLSTGCPDAWSPVSDLAGRVIVGAHTDRTAEFGYRAIGGEERHKLTDKEMPRHAHGKGREYFYTHSTESPDRFVLKSDAGNENSIGFNKDFLYNKGSGEPHNNMPPYIALYFCKKG